MAFEITLSICVYLSTTATFSFSCREVDHKVTAQANGTLSNLTKLPC